MKTAEEVINEIEILGRIKWKAYSGYSYEQDTELGKDCEKQQMKIMESYAKERAIEFLRSVSGENPSKESDKGLYDMWIKTNQ